MTTIMRFASTVTLPIVGGPSLLVGHHVAAPVAAQRHPIDDEAADR
jgi:hypothetical protein